MPRHSCCEVRVMQLHDILLLRASAILPEAISVGGLTPTTDTSLFLNTYRGRSHLPADIAKSRKSPISIVENNKQWIGACGLDNIRKSVVPSDILWSSYFVMNKQ